MDVTTLAAAMQYTDKTVADVNTHGVKGDTGPQGDTGPKGDTGDTYELTNQDKEDIAALVSIPSATVSTLGAVKPDGTTITIDANGVISLAIPDGNEEEF